MPSPLSTDFVIPTSSCGSSWAFKLPLPSPLRFLFSSLHSPHATRSSLLAPPPFLLPSTSVWRVTHIHLNLLHCHCHASFTSFITAAAFKMSTTVTQLQEPAPVFNAGKEIVSFTHRHYPSRSDAYMILDHSSRA